MTRDELIAEGVEAAARAIIVAGNRRYSYARLVIEALLSRGWAPPGEGK